MQMQALVARGGRTSWLQVCGAREKMEVWEGDECAVEMAAAAAAMVVEGEKKIRVRVLGDEDDDMAESDWLIW